MRRTLRVLTAALAAVLASAGTAGAVTFHLSTLGGNTIGGLSYTGGDVVSYDDVAGTATEVFDERDHWPAPGEELDAFELLDNGNFVFSFAGPVILDSQQFFNGDIFEYDPVTGVATPLFDENNFTGNADIDAVAVLPNGNLLFSTAEDENGLAGAPNILDGDIIEWDPLTNSYVGIYRNEAFFEGGDVDIDAFDVAADGSYYAFSLLSDGVVFGTPANDGDLVRYDISTDTAVIWLGEGLFTGPATSPLDAIAVPEPSTAALFAFGLLGLALAGGRRRA